MPRINHKEKHIHVIMLCALLSGLVWIHAPAPAFAQNQMKAASEQPESSQEEQPASTGSPVIDLIKASQEKKSQMRTMNWDSSKYKNKISKKTDAEEDEEKAKKEETKTTETGNEENLTESQKVWEHYATLAGRIKKKKQEQLEGDENTDQPEKKEEVTQEEETKEKIKEETASEEKEPAPEGISEILKRYKETQKNQGPMNSRSFGSID